MLQNWNLFQLLDLEVKHLLLYPMSQDYLLNQKEGINNMVMNLCSKMVLLSTKT